MSKNRAPQQCDRDGMFNEIDTNEEKTSRLSEQQRDNGSYFNDNNYKNASMLYFANNKNPNCGVNYFQNTREPDFEKYLISKKGDLGDIEPKIDPIRPRSRTSPYQLEVLENVCRTTLKPNKETRIRLAKELKMTERQVQIWFQNKRAKSKKGIEIYSPRNQKNVEMNYQQNYVGYDYENNNMPAYTFQQSGFSNTIDNPYYAVTPKDESEYLSTYCHAAIYPQNYPDAKYITNKSGYSLYDRNYYSFINRNQKYEPTSPNYENSQRGRSFYNEEEDEMSKYYFKPSNENHYKNLDHNNK